MAEEQAKARAGTRRGRKSAADARTPQLKDMILSALDEAGGVQYLVRQAQEDPARFMTLVAKVLPLQDEAEEGLARQLARALAWKPPT